MLRLSNKTTAFVNNLFAFQKEEKNSKNPRFLFKILREPFLERRGIFYEKKFFGCGSGLVVD